MITKQLLTNYELLKAKIAELDVQVKDIQKQIMTEIAANEELRIDDKIVKHNQYPVERFALKKALEVLDKRELKPFITTSIVDKVTIRKAA